VEKVNESEVVLSREFHIFGAHTWKARELKTSFIRGTVIIQAAFNITPSEPLNCALILF